MLQKYSYWDFCASRAERATIEAASSAESIKKYMQNCSSSVLLSVKCEGSFWRYEEEDRAHIMNDLENHGTGKVELVDLERKSKANKKFWMSLMEYSR